ncbi:hypothetical protein Metfor_2053 [Methanoregula formicica SMSP]|uniref:Uncharacterized protein n=1 Tax=Methanoregula formicica (strain DSM 22288 / NBRC 105244 / SMSP) TaxID=593750 RepID=L0HH10_METFS|nr:hypothetical protein Metfor_2053 [Methanoregula formicica SMSP]
MLLLEERIKALNAVKKDGAGLDYYDFVRWCSKTWQTVEGIYGADDPRVEELRTLALFNCSCNASMQALILAEDYHARLISFIDEIREGMAG